jgi:hypothetical protein
MREACTPRREVADSPFDYAPLKNEGHAYYSYLQERRAQSTAPELPPS